MTYNQIHVFVMFYRILCDSDMPIEITLHVLMTITPITIFYHTPPIFTIRRVFPRTVKEWNNLRTPKCSVIITIIISYCLRERENVNNESELITLRGRLFNSFTVHGKLF